MDIHRLKKMEISVELKLKGKWVWMISL